MANLYPQKTSRTCHKCGNFLILIKETVEHEEGQYSPVTTSIFECSDKLCDKDTKKETVIRVKLHKKQELMKKNRMKNIQISRKKAFLAKQIAFKG